LYQLLLQFLPLLLVLIHRAQAFRKMGVQSKEAPIPPWGLAIAGAAGAVIANTLVYPLDMYDSVLLIIGGLY